MTEAELRVLIASEPEKGFRELFGCYKGYVYGIVWEHLRAVGTKEDAEECVSDVFTEVFFHFPEIREGMLQGYIGMAAKRQAIDVFRRLTAKRRAGTLSETAALSVPSAADVEAEMDSFLKLLKPEDLGESGDGRLLLNLNEPGEYEKLRLELGE